MYRRIFILMDIVEKLEQQIIVNTFLIYEPASSPNFPCFFELVSVLPELEKLKRGTNFSVFLIKL